MTKDAGSSDAGIQQEAVRVVESGREGTSSSAAPNRSSAKFADYIVEIAALFEADIVYPVMDNVSSHTRTALVGAVGE